jgi:hypothetical protein
VPWRPAKCWRSCGHCQSVMGPRPTHILFISSLVKCVVFTTSLKILDAFQEMVSLSSAAQISSMCIPDITLTWPDRIQHPPLAHQEGGRRKYATFLTGQLGRTLKIGQSAKTAPPAPAPLSLVKEPPSVTMALRWKTELPPMTPSATNLHLPPVPKPLVKRWN